MNLSKIKQSSLAVMLVIIFAKLVGMLRDVVLANYFGTSNISDAYLIASSVPTLLFYFIGHSIATAYLPIYNKVKIEKGVAEAQSYSNNLLTISMLISSLIVAVLLIFPNFVVKLFAAGFDRETANIAIGIIRISALSIYFMTVLQIFGGYLNAHKNFLVPAAISLPRNIAIVISIVLTSFWGIEWLGIGLLVAYLFEFLFVLPFVLKKGFRYCPIVKFDDRYIKQTLYVVIPILLGMCVGQVNKIVDRSMASSIVEGGVSALSYASIINNAIQEILVTGIITILFANCAELVAKNEHNAIKQRLQNTLSSIGFLLVPASIGVIVLAEPIVKLILYRGGFNETSLVMTVGALRCYTIGLLFLAIRDTLVKVFYAYKDTKKATATSVISILLNILLNIILGYVMGINGLALATSLSAIFNSIVLIILLNRKIGDFGIYSTLKVFLKSIIGATIMGIIVYFANHVVFQNIPSLISLLLSVVLGLVVYFVIEMILLNKPMIDFLTKLKCFKKNRENG